jgi:hypothetical protein
MAPAATRPEPLLMLEMRLEAARGGPGKPETRHASFVAFAERRVG